VTRYTSADRHREAGELAVVELALAGVNAGAELEP
jgi:hypothetical protein